MKHLMKNTHYHSTGRENISVLVDNIISLSDSQVQETVLEALSEFSQSPFREKNIYTENLLLRTPSKFKIKRSLHSPPLK